MYAQSLRKTHQVFLGKFEETKSYFLLQVMVQVHNRKMSLSVYISALAVADTVTLILGEHL